MRDDRGDPTLVTWEGLRRVAGPWLTKTRVAVWGGAFFIVCAILVWQSYIGKIIHTPLTLTAAEMRIGPGNAESMVLRAPRFTIQGTFSRDTWVEAALFDVRDGEARVASKLTVGRSSSMIPYVLWADVTVTLALPEKQEDGQRNVDLWSSGGRMYGCGCPMGVDFEVADRVFFRGPVERKHEYLLFAAGDREIDAAREMSPKEFAERNRGRYALLMMYVH